METVKTYAEALEFAKELDVILVPYELEEGMKATMSIIEAIRPGQSVGIFIGPEGGFEEQEIGQARNAGAVPVTLGRRILRTETAGITTLSNFDVSSGVCRGSVAFSEKRTYFI